MRTVSTTDYLSLCLFSHLTNGPYNPCLTTQSYSWKIQLCNRYVAALIDGDCRPARFSFLRMGSHGRKVGNRAKAIFPVLLPCLDSNAEMSMDESILAFGNNHQIPTLRQDILTVV